MKSRRYLENEAIKGKSKIASAMTPIGGFLSSILSNRETKMEMSVSGNKEQFSTLMEKTCIS